MDQAKTFRHKTRQRIASLPDTSLGEMSSSLERLRQISSSPTLPKNFSTGKRHTIHVKYSSSMQDITEQFKYLFNHSPEFYAEQRREGDTIKGTNSDIETKRAHLPALQRSPLTPDLPPAKQRSLKRMHSYGDDCERTATIRTSYHEWPLVKSEGNHTSSTVQGARPTFPQIGRLVKHYRRYSLPVSTENTTDLYSMSFPSSENLEEGRVAQTKEANPLPQVTHASFVNLTLKQADEHSLDETECQIKQPSQDMGYHHCIRANQTRPSAKEKSDGNDEENDKVQALRTHIEKAETGFNEVEARAVRLFEWLRDQSDNES